MTDNLDPDQVQRFIRPDQCEDQCVETVCRGYQQMTLDGKELTLKRQKSRRKNYYVCKILKNLH